MVDMKVLVVEDDQTLLSVLEYNLKKGGYKVVTATDGIEALAIAQAERPNLVLLDIMLPKLDGLEVCRILRKESAVPILMLTAKAEEVDKVVGLELGADDYLTKPFSMRELLARVKAMLRRAPTPLGTTRAADELNGHRAPEEARLFVYDVSTQKLVRDLVPVSKGRTTGLITEVAPGRMLGLASDPARPFWQAGAPLQGRRASLELLRVLRGELGSPGGPPARPVDRLARESRGPGCMNRARGGLF